VRKNRQILGERIFISTPSAREWPRVSFTARIERAPSIDYIDPSKLARSLCRDGG